jgi:LemA protein
MEWITLAVLAAVAVYGIVIYNGLVALKNRVRNAFSQIDVQLQRRYDLIPNLVETAKAYMAHERDTLEAVIAARNQASAAARHAQSSQPGAIAELAGAEAALGGLLTRFFALAEAYPDLKANQNMAQLQEELASTENRVAFARQAYNDATMSYNTRREQFPDSLIAGLFRFDAAEMWQMENQEARHAPRVDFGPR